MIKHNNCKQIEEKILKIDTLTKKIGAEFDNATTNKFMIIYKDYQFKFNTYDDVLNALGLLGVIKIVKLKSNNTKKESD